MDGRVRDRKSTRLNSSHLVISYAVFCLKKKRIYEGWQVPMDYDPLLSKLIAYAPTREHAIARLQRALEEYHVGGIKTNLFFFHDTATTEIYTLSLHDALPIRRHPARDVRHLDRRRARPRVVATRADARSEEHTSELQSPCKLVCRLLLEK